MDKTDPFFVAQGLYLTMDALYDTRLATLEMIDPRLVHMALQAGYTTRKEDSFPMVSKEAFQKAYALRDTEFLERALPTDVFRIIQEFIQQSVPRSLNNPWGQETEVFLNVYPYKIDKVTAQAMLEPMLGYTGGIANVSLINMSIEELTPGYCRNNFGVMAMYDYQEWLDYHAKVGHFNGFQMPKVDLVVPRLYETRVPSDEELKQITKTLGHDPFRDAEIEAAGLIGLSYATVEAFCARLSPQDYQKIAEMK